MRGCSGTRGSRTATTPMRGSRPPQRMRAQWDLLCMPRRARRATGFAAPNGRPISTQGDALGTKPPMRPRPVGVPRFTRRPGAPGRSGIAEDGETTLLVLPLSAALGSTPIAIWLHLQRVSWTGARGRRWHLRLLAFSQARRGASSNERKILQRPLRKASQALETALPRARSLLFHPDQEHRQDELGQYPGPRRRAVPRGQVAQVEDALHPLEGQLDLPAVAARLPRPPRGEPFGAQVRQEPHRPALRVQGPKQPHPGAPGRSRMRSRPGPPAASHRPVPNTAPCKVGRATPRQSCSI
jgi:hypothetical protein